LQKPDCLFLAFWQKGRAAGGRGFAGHDVRQLSDMESPLARWSEQGGWRSAEDLHVARELR
jgi:hypothetical protein